MADAAGPRRLGLGCAHLAILIVVGFAVSLLTVPPLAFAVGALQSALGPSAPTTKDIVFYVWIPMVAAITIWVSRRVNPWLDRRVGASLPRILLLPRHRDGGASVPRLKNVDGSREGVSRRRSSTRRTGGSARSSRR